MGGVWVRVNGCGWLGSAGETLWAETLGSAVTGNHICHTREAGSHEG